MGFPSLSCQTAQSVRALTFAADQKRSLLIIVIQSVHSNLSKANEKKKMIQATTAKALLHELFLDSALIGYSPLGPGLHHTLFAIQMY